MKLKLTRIRSFRGVATELTLHHKGRSLCLLGENGSGKSTIVDALEFWSSGDVAHYHREGYQLDCLVHVDADEAEVECETTLHPLLVRGLSRSGATGLSASAPMSVDKALPPPLPILRHRTMAQFMDQSPGDKKATLLEMFGLEELTRFRKALNTTRNSARERAQTAASKARDEVDTLRYLTDGRPLLQAAEAFRQASGIETPVASEKDLLEVQLTLPASVPDRIALVADLRRALGRVSPEVVRAWNAALAKPEVHAADALARLLTAAASLLPGWDAESCPLCLSEVDQGGLAASVARRCSDALHAARQLHELEHQMNQVIEAVETLEAAVRALLAGAPADGWPKQESLEGLSEVLREFSGALRRALDDRQSCAEVPDLTWIVVEELNQAASASTSDARAAGVAGLVRLRDQLARRQAAELAALSARRGFEGVDALLSVADTEIRAAIERVLARIGARAANYYSRLVPGPIYQDVELTYTPGRAGGVEFRLEYDARHSVSPPQRIMSESQLNALGLALFLARVREEGLAWKTLILDDVVNSFDASHRVGLIDLLRDEFADWQVLLFTHDRVFADLARRILPSWDFGVIAAWSPKGGPILTIGSVREQLKDRLDDGRGAGELGGLARVALEQALARPLERLRLPIYYDPHARYSAMDLLEALRKGLKDKKSDIAAAPVLNRMSASAYLTNLGAHDRPKDPGLTTDDLRQLLADLDEFDKAFECESCGKPVWSATTDGGRRHQCNCSALAV